ncbi:MAG: hypothetical protein ACI4NG_00630 [Candidatus Gallimonas sp.]
MKAYVLSIAGVVLLSAVVTIVSPGGGTGKFLRGIVKLACVAVLVAPFARFFAVGETELFRSTAAEEDGAYFLRCSSFAEEWEAEKIEAYLSERFSVVAEAEAECSEQSPFFVKRLVVRVKDFGINPSGEHINIIREIESALRGAYGCEVEVS